MKKNPLKGSFQEAARLRLEKCKSNTQVFKAGVEMLGIVADRLVDIADALEAGRR